MRSCAKRSSSVASGTGLPAMARSSPMCCAIAFPRSSGARSGSGRASGGANLCMSGAIRTAANQPAAPAGTRPGQRLADGLERKPRLAGVDPGLQARCAEAVHLPEFAGQVEPTRPRGEKVDAAMPARDALDRALDEAEAVAHGDCAPRLDHRAPLAGGVHAASLLLEQLDEAEQGGGLRLADPLPGAAALDQVLEPFVRRELARPGDEQRIAAMAMSSAMPVATAGCLPGRRPMLSNPWPICAAFSSAQKYT